MTDGNEPINMDVTNEGTMGGNFGLTKREYFAAMRKEPIFGSDTMAESWAKIIMGTEIPVGPSIENIQWWVSAHERFSVIRADALIEALNKQP